MASEPADRKWVHAPMHFSGIIGHEPVCQHLRHIVQTGRLPHAILFSGPPGVGKRRVVETLIQTLFCESPRLDDAGLPDSCGQCAGCRLYQADNHPDLDRVYMDDGKTRISVDQVREACQFLSLTAMRGRWKIVVMDDASWMNEFAFNALLKTLEEPMPHAALFLITTNAGALLPTIRSRCQQVRFNALTATDMDRLLALQTTADEQTRQHAIRLAEGSIAAALELCRSDAPIVALQHEFTADLQRLVSHPLADLIGIAEKWSQKGKKEGTDKEQNKLDRFVLFISLLRTHVHDMIHARAGHDPWAGETLAHQARWVAYSKELEDASQAAMRYNLNQQMVLESLLIQYRRQRG